MRKTLYVYEPSEKYFELIKDMKQLESMEKVRNNNEINNTPKLESGEKEKKVRFAGVAKEENVTDDVRNTPEVERNHPAAGANENTDTTPVNRSDGVVSRVIELRERNNMGP